MQNKQKTLIEISQFLFDELKIRAKKSGTTPEQQIENALNKIAEHDIRFSEDFLTIGNQAPQFYQPAHTGGIYVRIN